MKKGVIVMLICAALASCTGGAPQDEPQSPEDTAATTLPEDSPDVTDSPDVGSTAGSNGDSAQKTPSITYDYDNLTYELVWSDEFDYEGLPDNDKWDYDEGGNGWGNNELQYYTTEGNAWVDGEKLIIELRAEEMYFREYTSARLVSRNKGDWLYGKIEVRAKIPEGLGTWPAIWMLPTDWKYGGWPLSGEIDIMEHVGFDPNRVHASIHTYQFNHTKRTNKGSGPQDVPTATSEYHVYSIEWLPDCIHFYFDDVKVYTYNPLNYTDEVTFANWPFDQRFHLLINIAWGGNWGGVHGIDPDVLPQHLEVDYVRVYQSPEITALSNGA